jgi:acyl carrier protein
MNEALRSDLARIIYEVDGEQKKPDGSIYSRDELFETPLDELDIDSLSFLEIIMKIEEHLGGELDDIDPEKYRKISDLETDLIAIGLVKPAAV